MAKKLTQEQIDRGAMPVMTLIAYAGGLIDIPNGDPYPDKMYAYSRFHLQDGSFKRASKIICDEILGRAFKDVDGAISDLTSFRFNRELSAYNSPAFRVKADKLATYIAWLCKHLGIYWDDSDTSIASAQEISHFKTTLLGQALTDYGCYTTSPVTNKTSATTTSASTTRVAGQPQNNYKSLGPQSGNARDLKGQPGDKTSLSMVLRIITDAKDKHLFIKPLNAGGASGSTNKVMWGTAHGYTDCEVLFADVNTADAFLVKAKNAGIIPTALQANARIARTSPLSNGYFLIGTEFGDVYVSAKKFNEELKIEIEPTAVDTEDTIYESIEATANFENTLPKVNRSYRQKVEDLMEEKEEELAAADENSIININLDTYRESIMKN